MSNIEFRAKSMNKKDTQWYYGLIKSISEDGSGFINCPHKNCIHIDASTIGQYTGVLDINGVKIYEGDILILVEDYTREEDFEAFIAGQVKFNYGSFFVDDNCISRYDWRNYVYEIIGNIHDNPELLKGE